MDKLNHLINIYFVSMPTIATTALNDNMRNSREQRLITKEQIATHTHYM